MNGISFAAVRDWNAFARYETKDDFGTPNPLAGDVTRIYTEISSQPGRLLNDFTHLGFNQAENGKIVVDGLMQWIAAGDDISMNYRFSQPGRTERNRQDHLYQEGVFPFANVATTDPITGKTDSRYARCTATSTCPFAMEIFSANEYWVKAASLMTTDPTGKTDLADSPFTRIYFMSSMQHGTGNGASKGNCQQFLNPLNSSPVQRALFVAMDDWVTKSVAPPPSQAPKLSDGTLVPPLPQAKMGFPSIPGVTYTGWALRAGAQANDGCESSGQYIPFAKTKDERIAAGDPRLSMEERYGNFSIYQYMRLNAVNDLLSRRLLLPEDAYTEFTRSLQTARTTGGLKDRELDSE